MYQCLLWDCLLKTNELASNDIWLECHLVHVDSCLKRLDRNVSLFFLRHALIDFRGLQIPFQLLLPFLVPFLVSLKWIFNWHIRFIKVVRRVFAN